MVRKFSWEAVEPRGLVVKLLETAYEQQGRDEDRRRVRRLDDELLRHNAARALGRPPRGDLMELLTPVLLHDWLPRAAPAVVDDLLSAVTHSLSADVRREASTLTTKASKVAFIQDRNVTGSLRVKLRRAFINAHKVDDGLTRSKGRASARERTSRVLLRPGSTSPQEWKPYEHQIEAHRALDQLARGRTPRTRSGLLVIPTGGGKTATMVTWLLMRLGERRGLRVLWLADQQELVDQAAATFGSFAHMLPEGSQRVLRVVHGQAGAASSLASSEVDIVCATRQSLISGRTMPLLTAFLERPCVVVVDEAHHAVSPTYVDLIESMRASQKDLLLVGLTATPWPSGAGQTARLRNLFPVELVRVSTRDLVLRRQLATPVVHTYATSARIRVDEEERRAIAGRDLPPSVLRKLDTHARNELIVQTWQDRKETWGKTLVFACTTDHADHLADRFRDAGETVDVIHSAMDAERNAVLAAFRAQAGPAVLVSVNMLLEGVDIPSARTAFLCRPTSSRVVMQQMIGRVLRGQAAGGDPVAHLVDMHDVWDPGLDILAPLDIPVAGAEKASTETSSAPARRLPAIVTEAGDPVPEDVVRRIERALADKRRVWGQKAVLTPCRLTGYYALDDLSIPVFEHTVETWEALGEASTAGSPPRDPKSWFESLPLPVPVDTDVTAFTSYCREYAARPPFVPMALETDVRDVARRLAAAPPMTEPERHEWLRREHETTLARTQYPDVQMFVTAVSEQSMVLHGLVPSGAEPERVRVPDSTPPQKLRRSKDRDLVPLLRSTLRTARTLVADEPEYAGLLERDRLPEVDWTMRPGRTTWAHYSWRSSTRARGNPVIRVNLALRAPKSQISDALLEYLLWHELCHHLVPERGHDVEFRRVEALWPDHLALDHELDTLHERFVLPSAQVKAAGSAR